MDIKRVSTAIILAVGINFGAVLSASALKVDFATKRANSPGWTSMGECTAANNEFANCVSIYDDCGGYDIYSTDAIFDGLIAAINRGESIDINIIKDGRFAGYLCKLDPR